MNTSRFYLNGLTEEYTQKLNACIKPNSNVFIVGWRPDSSLWAYDFFSSINSKIHLIEIFSENANAFPKLNYPNVEVTCDDVQNYKKYLTTSGNSVMYWGEGPEHLPMEVSKKLLQEMKKHFDTIIIHTPYGEYNQGEMYGNIYEAHLSTWYEIDYEQLHFEHARFHGPDQNFDAIIGFWSKS